MENMENQDQLENIIELVDENGNTTAFEYLDVIDYQGKEYLALLPADEDNDEIVILEIEPVNDEEENYLSVDDEETLMAVYAIFKEKFKDIFDFAE